MSQAADMLSADYSGEFSHWNFSMRIKKWIDQGVPNDNINVSNPETDFPLHMERG